MLGRYYRMAKFTYLKSRVVVMPNRNIDTDQIIPARFLKTTDKNGLGEALFSDWRYNSDGSAKPDFALNREQNQNAKITHPFQQVKISILHHVLTSSQPWQ